MSAVNGITERTDGGRGPGPGYYRPTGLETTTSWLLGFDDAPELPEPDASPRRALEAEVLPALESGSCFVSFSGGRDSSAVLAVACSVARREGLPMPVPVTLVYPGLDEADESSWQRSVIDHLGITDWLRIPINEEQDLLGASARAGLSRRGLLWPASIHLQHPLLSQVAGGYLLSGEGGDEILGPRRITPATILLRNRARPSRSRIRTTARALAPAPARRRSVFATLSHEVPTPWLSTHTRRWLLSSAAADDASEPLRWDDALVWLLRRRVARVLAHNDRLVAAEYGVASSDPLLSPRFVAALRPWGGAWGFRGRTANLRRLFGDLLPYDVVSRSSKAYFNRAYFGPGAREFAHQWSGGGIDTTRVDAQRLRAEWLADLPSGLTALMLHAAWLHDEGLSKDGAMGK